MKELKKLLLFAVAISFGIVTSAQVKNPVIWKFEAKKKGTDYEVIVTATIKKPWHIYSQNTGKGGPVATTITFNKSPLITLEGTTKETGKLEKIYDNIFKADVIFYSNTVVFTQIVKLKGDVKTNITGTVEYMACNDEQCLPPTKKPFDIKL